MLVWLWSFPGLEAAMRKQKDAWQAGLEKVSGCPTEGLRKPHLGTETSFHLSETSKCVL